MVNYVNSVFINGKATDLTKEEVKALQTYLNSLYAQTGSSTRLDVDGKLGPATNQAINELNAKDDLEFVLSSAVERAKKRTNDAAPVQNTQAITRGAVQYGYLNETDYSIVRKFANGLGLNDLTPEERERYKTLPQRLQPLNQTGKQLSWGEWDQYLSQNHEGFQYNVNARAQRVENQRQNQEAAKQQRRENAAKFEGAVVDNSNQAAKTMGVTAFNAAFGAPAALTAGAVDQLVTGGQGMYAVDVAAGRNPNAPFMERWFDSMGDGRMYVPFGSPEQGGVLGNAGNGFVGQVLNGVGNAALNPYTWATFGAGNTLTPLQGVNAATVLNTPAMVADAINSQNPADNIGPIASGAVRTVGGGEVGAVLPGTGVQTVPTVHTQTIYTDKVPGRQSSVKGFKHGRVRGNGVGQRVANTTSYTTQEAVAPGTVKVNEVGMPILISPASIHNDQKTATYNPSARRYKSNFKLWEPQEQVVMVEDQSCVADDKEFEAWYAKQPEGTEQHFKGNKCHPAGDYKIVRSKTAEKPQPKVLAMNVNGSSPSGIMTPGTTSDMVTSQGSVTNARTMPLGTQIPNGDKVLVSDPYGVQNGQASIYNQGTAGAFKNGGSVNYLQYIKNSERSIYFTK